MIEINTSSTVARLLGLVFFLCGLPGFIQAQDKVVLLANSRVPESVELARYYAAKRNIPSEQLCILDLPASEGMSRKAYEEQLRDPLLSFLRDRRLIAQVKRKPTLVRPHETRWKTTASSVRYLVSFYGVPLRIESTESRILARITGRSLPPVNKDTAAVDAELACLLLGPYDIHGPIPNPLYRRYTWKALSPQAKRLILATRLDGPEPSVVRRMMDQALEAESAGLQGRAVFDLTPERGNAYEQGNRWLEGANHAFLRNGFECTLEISRELIPEHQPLDQVAVYMGWYGEHLSGLPAREGFLFQPGSIAYHLHSSSALSLRKANRYWAGPMLQRGACATMGAVSEPFLSFTPALDVFAERILEGRTFAESAYMSLSHLSWQIAVIGDPLYRPFKVRPGDGAGPWNVLAEAKQMLRAGRYMPAVELLENETQNDPTFLLKEYLGDVYMLNQQPGKAREYYMMCIQQSPSEASAFRSAGKLLDFEVPAAQNAADSAVHDLKKRYPKSLFWKHLEPRTASHD